MAPKYCEKKNFASKEVEAGKKYWFCTCKMSHKYPICDGAHKLGSSLKPLLFEAEKSETVYFCEGKVSNNPPSD